MPRYVYDEYRLTLRPRTDGGYDAIGRAPDGSIQQGNDFLWDENLKPTPAVQAIQNLLR